MKRYWKILFLSVFIVVTFGVLYIHHAIAEEELPEFELVTVSGDEQIAENFVIYGDYQVDPIWEPFQLSNEGIAYLRDFSYSERLRGIFIDPTINRLIEEDREFMRAKDRGIELFFENEEMVVYVGPYVPSDNNFEFDVDILDKASGERQTFSVEIPERESIDYLYVEEVQLLDGTLHVVTHNFSPDVQDVHVYEIDIKDGKIMNHQSIAEAKMDDYVVNLNSYYDHTEQAYWVMSIDEVEWDDEGYYEILSSETIAYHLESGEKHTIELPEEAQQVEQDGMENYDKTAHLSVGKDYLHFFNFTQEGITLQSYHLGEKELGSKKTISIEENVSGGLRGVYPYGDKVYFFSDVEDNNATRKKLFGVDLATAQIHYEGEIKLKNSPREMTVHNLEIHDLRVR